MHRTHYVQPHHKTCMFRFVGDCQMPSIVMRKILKNKLRPKHKKAAFVRLMELNDVSSPLNAPIMITCHLAT